MNNENILVKYDNVSISFDNGDNMGKRKSLIDASPSFAAWSNTNLFACKFL